MEWEIDLSEVNGLRGWYGKQPKLIQRASAMLLNEYAFEVRRGAVKHIDRLMIVRNARFVDSRMRVTKAGYNTPINQQRSVTGSVASPRFTGWTEQEGGPTRRTHYATLAGRGGNKQKQIRPVVRFKPGTDILDRDDYPTPDGGRTNVGGYFAIMRRLKENRMMRIGKVVYKRNRNKIQPVQILGKKPPKRVAWMKQARAIYFRTHNPQTTWAKVVSRVLKPPPKR